MELNVAKLVTEGLTNSAIVARLVMSPGRSCGGDRADEEQHAADEERSGRRVVEPRDVKAKTADDEERCRGNVRQGQQLLPQGPPGWLSVVWVEHDSTVRALMSVHIGRATQLLR